MSVFTNRPLPGRSRALGDVLPGPEPVPPMPDPDPGPDSPWPEPIPVPEPEPGPDPEVRMRGSDVVALRGRGVVLDGVGGASELPSPAA